MKEMKIGVAVGLDVVVAWVEGGAAEYRRVPISRTGEGEPGVAELTGAFEELRAVFERSMDSSLAGRARLSVALLPPLAQFRQLDLPPLADAEAEALLQREAARYFPGGAQRRTVALVPRAGKDAPLRAVAASSALLEALTTAIREAGFRLDRLVSAHCAWAASAGAGGGEGRQLVVAEGREVQILDILGRRIEGVRRTPAGPENQWTELVTAGEVTLLGSGESLQAARSALETTGVRLRTPQHGPDAAGMAARGALGAEPVLVPEGLAEERRSAAAGMGRRLLALTAVLIVIAVAVHNVGLRRELGATQEARAALRAEVAPLLDARDSLIALNDEVRALREVSRRSHDWAAAISEVSYLLPRETYLTSLTGSEGALEFEAAGARAGVALDALRGARTLSGVRLQGLVERELEDGATVVERFRIGARVTGGESAPLGTENR